MADYLKQHGTKQTPQSEPIPGSGQVENSAGGFAWQVDEWTRLNRFLILSTEGGSYYASERDLTKENIDGVRAAIAKDGPRVVTTLLDVSLKGRAPKQSPTLYVLAMCISSSSGASLETRQAAAEAVPRICRTATMLFEFLGYAKANRGLGRGLKHAIRHWYEHWPIDDLGYQTMKYRNREGWTHRDALRISHPRSVKGELRSNLFNFICRGSFTGEVPNIVYGFQCAQKAATPKESEMAIREFRLPRECVRPEHLNSIEVWQALLDAPMPMTAMIRNLGKMTNVGLLKPLSAASKQVVEALGDVAKLRKSRIHPIAILAALRTYQQGHGERGKLTWDAVSQIVDALDGAFYAAFGNVTPTGKNIMLALDVSGSMGHGNVAGIPNLTPREAAAAMAMVTLAVERNVVTCAYSSAGSHFMRTGPTQYGYGGDNGISIIDISKRRRLDDVVRAISNLPFGGTDCSLPMLYAVQENLEIDAFVSLTDSESWAGKVHVSQALQQYRAKSRRQHACNAVLAMVANDFSVADPTDPRQRDFCGFDTAVPELLSAFVRGEV